MSLRVLQVDFYQLPMRTRFPFRYGIASMTQLPHLFVLATIEVDGKTTCRGISADGLPPKWFTKNPDTTFDQDDLPAMRRVIRHAASVAVDCQEQPSLFAWWRQLYEAQRQWAADHSLASLLSGFGVSLIERAVIDAFCRSEELTLFQAITEEALGIDLGAVRPSLARFRPKDFLPAAPLRRVQLRHTVGLGDPLTDADISSEDRLEDGLPHSLVSSIQRYGLRYFKIKLQGDPTIDRRRLVRLASIISAHVGPQARCTLDANEQYHDIETFRRAYEDLRAEKSIREFLDRCLLVVEQPLHRDHALLQGVAAGLQDWPDSPPIIIDESDADLDSLPTALRLGYAGTSHKNCKGIFKSILGAGSIALHRQQGNRAVLTAEDLANVGPVALLQDLAMVASLGIEHVERNGHHYFAGLSMYPTTVQQQTCDDHSDLYRFIRRDASAESYAALCPEQGQLLLDSVNAAPFGVREIPDVERFEPWNL